MSVKILFETTEESQRDLKIALAKSAMSQKEWGNEAIERKKKEANLEGAFIDLNMLKEFDELFGIGILGVTIREMVRQMVKQEKSNPGTHPDSKMFKAKGIFD